MKVAFLWRLRNEILLITVGLILISILAFNIYKHELELKLFDLEVVANNIFTAVKVELKNTEEVLTAFKGLYSSSNDISREEFNKFYSSVYKNASGVQALEWIPRVTHDERKKYEIEARKEYKNFKIKGKNSAGVMTELAKKEEYFPVYYMQPYIGNEKALGFDLSSSKARKMALDKAIASKNITTTQRITLVQEQAKQYGFLMFLPVFTKSTDIKGFILGVFRAGDLLSTALNKIQQKNNTNYSN